jgi:hypothetical protein
MSVSKRQIEERIFISDLVFLFYHKLNDSTRKKAKGFFLNCLIDAFLETQVIIDVCYELKR